MTRFARLAILPLLMLSFLTLSGCGTIDVVKKGYDSLTGVKVSPNMVIVAANAFNVLEITATKYLALPLCDGKRTVCRVPSATKPIAQAVRSGRVARNNLELFLREHPGELGPRGAYDALTAASGTLQDVFAQYGVNK